MEEGGTETDTVGLQPLRLKEVITSRQMARPSSRRGTNPPATKETRTAYVHTLCKGVVSNSTVNIDSLRVQTVAFKPSRSDPPWEIME